MEEQSRPEIRVLSEYLEWSHSETLLCLRLLKKAQPDLGFDSIANQLLLLARQGAEVSTEMAAVLVIILTHRVLSAHAVCEEAYAV